MSKEFAGWTSTQFADLVQQVAALKESGLTAGMDMTRLGEEIQSTIAGNHKRVVVGTTGTTSPALKIENPVKSELAALEEKFARVEREMREAQQRDRRIKREAQQLQRNRLADEIRKQKFALDNSEQRLLEAFVMGSKTLEQLANIILGTHFRRDFNLHHLTSVSRAESMAEQWDELDTEELIVYLAGDNAVRQEMNKKMLDRIDSNDKHAPATGPARSPSVKMDSIREVLRDAEIARVEKEAKAARERLEYEAAEVRRRQAERELQDLEEIVLAEQRDALGAGEW